MMRIKFNFLHGVLWAVFLIGLISCSGVGPGNNATVPAPVAELPSLEFPESIAIDTQQLDVGGSKSQTALLSIGDSLNSDIERISVSSKFLLDFVDLTVLAPLSPLKIPRGINVTTFEDVIRIGDNLANIKIDFSPYRYNNQGAGLDCSGNTADLPICYRIWINDIKTLAGIFTTVPTPENPGIGQFKGFPLEEKIEGQIGALYDQQATEAKTTEIFTAVNDFKELGHGLLNEIINTTATFTTINLSFLENDNQTQNVARYRDDENFISLSQQSNVPGLMNYLAVCGDLLTRLVIEQSFCINADIDVTGIDFISFATPSDVNLPSDFPNTPPFVDSPFHSVP